MSQRRWLTGTKGVAISLAAMLTGAAGGTAAYYRYFVVGTLKARLAEGDEARQDLERANAVLKKRLDEARDANREVAAAAADRLDQDRSAALGMVDRVRADLQACRQARAQAGGSVAELEGELRATREELALLRQRLADADSVSRLLGNVGKLEDQRAGLVEERSHLVESLSSMSPEIVETDRQCVIAGPESQACSDASRLHIEQKALREEITFLQERIAQLDSEITRYRERPP